LRNIVNGKLTEDGSEQTTMPEEQYAIGVGLLREVLGDGDCAKVWPVDM